MFEKKRGTRFLASVMALVMLLSLAPVGALATEDEGQPAENQAVTQQAVVDTKDTNENTPTKPTGDSDSAEATKSEGGLDEGYSDEGYINVDADTSNNDNGIAAQNLSLNEPAQEQSITAEYWVTNRRVTAENSQSKIIESEDVNGATGKSVSELAPANGTCEDMDSVFWQARVLSGNDRQTMVNNSTSVDKGVEITTIKYENNQFEYQTVNGEWKTFNSDNNEQLVFYYLIHTNFVKDVQINISDWPLLDNKDSQFIYSSRFVRYEIYDSTESSDTAISQRTTWYNQARTISSVQVTMNENDEYRIDRIDCSYTYDNKWSDSNATSDVGSTFSIALNQDNNQYNAIVRIYVTKLRHELTVEYKKNTSDAPEIKTASKFYQLIDVNCKEYFNSNFESNGTLKENADVTTIGNQTISRDVAGYRFNHAVMSADKKTLTFYYDQLFKVTYNANGGRGDLPAKAEYLAGDTVTVAEKGNLEKTGHTFKGWEVDANNVGLQIENGEFTMPARDVVFTAVWENKETPIDPEPTSEIDAKYFVLTPSITAPVDGSSQGTGNYFPNDSDCGGVDGKKTSTGYPGKIKSNLLNNYPAVKTQAGYADTTNGIGADYLVLPADLGYFSTANYTEGVYTGYNSNKFPDVLKNLVGEGNQFDMNNYEIVWYVAKKEADGYHVDGYLKGVSIQLKYFDNFNGNISLLKTDTLESGDKVTIANKNIITGANARTGWTFEGWATKANGDGKLYKPDQEETLITSTSLYAKWTTTYDVVTHFVDANGKEETKTNSDLRAAHGKLLKELVLPRDQVDTENEYANYVYDASKTTYVVDSADPAPVGENKFTSANTVIHQYYYLDNWKDGDSKTPTEDDSATGGDGIPDCYQVLVKYQSGDLSKGKIADTARTQEVLTIKDKEKNVYLSEGQVVASGSTAEATGNRCYFSNWTDTIGKQVGTYATLGELPFDAVGGKTYTFTANFDRSSGGGGGGSRPSTPTVTIPDDVPTGLNGTDHYAYIIGYGNNDVRPQNNITRAEVATIFFRLLTDETREANMTKSNSYNDVKDGDWFCCAVSTLSKMGIIKGYEDGSFKPDQKTTRAETMTLVNRVLNRLPEAKDDLHKDMKTWVDNMDETAWYYLAVQEATNSHYFKNKTSTKFEQWTDLRDTRDWSELEK